jgi:transposase
MLQLLLKSAKVVCTFSRGYAKTPINRLRQWRRLATRYEKRAAYHQAMWVIAATLLWL